jgi:hypothetical protein
VKSKLAAFIEFCGDEIGVLLLAFLVLALVLALCF